MNAIANQSILNGDNSNNSTIIPDNSANTGVAIVTRVLSPNTEPIKNINAASANISIQK